MVLGKDECRGEAESVRSKSPNMVFVCLGLGVLVLLNLTERAPVCP